MKRTPNHYSCRKGKRVRVQLTNGEVIIDKFKGKGSNHVKLENRKILNKNIVSFVIYKRREEGE